MKDIKDKVALVTGAASGIGRATALAFAKKGTSVVIVDTQEKLGESTANEAADFGVQSLFLSCDVSSETAVDKMLKEAIKKFGRIDFAFNNAGIEGDQAPTQDCKLENWNKVIDINLKGIWLCMKYQIPQMLQQGSGVIINCSSIAGVSGFPNIPAYTASKHGIIGLTKTAALELAQSNIRVNCVCPGVIETPMIERFTHGQEILRKQLIQREPMGRVGRPEEIADAVLWLCSSGASFVTGHPLIVDGGWVAH